MRRRLEQLHRVEPRKLTGDAGCHRPPRYLDVFQQHDDLAARDVVQALVLQDRPLGLEPNGAEAFLFDPRRSIWFRELDRALGQSDRQLVQRHLVHRRRLRLVVQHLPERQEFGLLQFDGTVARKGG